MSTELCINYSDEIIRNVGCSLDAANKSYSNLGMVEKNLLKAALDGNVKSEYDFSMLGISYDRNKLINCLGDAESVRKEACLHHSAVAQVPDALVQAAFINYFGGYATIPNRKKALEYVTKACLQGNYDAVGLLQDSNSIVMHPIIAVYKLEFFINQQARSLCETFHRTFEGDAFDAPKLSPYQYRYLYKFFMKTTTKDKKLNLFLRANRNLILKIISDFALGCIDKIRRDLTPDQEDTKEFLHFIKCLFSLEEIKDILCRERCAKSLIGNLNLLCNEIKEDYSNNPFSRMVFDKGIEIVITRLFLENYSHLEQKKGSKTLKALVDKIMMEIESEDEGNPYRHSPYVLRMIGLYELFTRNSEIREKLQKALNTPALIEFKKIAQYLDLEKLVVASLSDSSKKYHGETVWQFKKNEILGYNRADFLSYLSDKYKALVDCFVRICDCINMQSADPASCNALYEDCELFIRSYMDLDPVLAYNTCDFSLKLGAFIVYAVDQLSFPPTRLAALKKPVPFYGYTNTSALGLYLLAGTRGQCYGAISNLNKAEQDLAQLRQKIAERDLSNIVTGFIMLQNTPLENYDYLLTELVHKLCCYDIFEVIRDVRSHDLFANITMLVRILITRAKIQEETKTGGIAAECLASLVQRRHFYDFLEHLVAGDKRTYEEHMSLKGELTCFEALTTCKYPTGKDDACVMIGECRDYGLYAFNKVNSYFILIRNTMCKRELSNEDKTLLKQHIIYYYRLFLAYNLCNPLKVNHDNLVSFNRGDICCLRNEIYPDNTNGKDKPNDFYFPPVNVPFMKVMDASAPEGKDSDKDSAKGADSIKDKIKKLDFDKVHGYERETSEEVNTSKIHYVLANIDKPVHIIGNRKLSEILNNRIIKPLKSDKKTLEKYGINCVPNFILYGEPGCGKTEAVSQFCMHLGLEPVVINSATIGATSIHETPGKIHEKFKEAFEKKNGVVIIDEADVFLNDRASLREDLDYKFEEIGAFLQCFDKAVKNHTLIISMTNYLDRIDKAIIREGRLGIHIEVTKPDEMDLEEIIEHCFEKSELEKLDKAQMVKALNGKTLASVFSIFNGIRMDVVMNDAELSQQYVMQKINTALGYTLKPGAHFSLPGQQKFEDYVNKKIVHHLLNPDVYRNFKIKFPNSMLLYGPTGTGKTYAAKELAKFLGWNFVKLDSKSIGSEYVQGSAIKIARVFDRARREAPCILFIDEIDAWLPKRSERSSRSDISQVNEFLSNMSQLNADNLLLIGTTNRLDDIDEAALRYGRFSTKIEIGYMKGAQVENLLNSLIEDIPYDDTINLSEIAKSLDNKSVADIVAFFEKACRFGAENKYSLLTEECFSKAMNNELKQDKCHRIGFL